MWTTASAFHSKKRFLNTRECVSPTGTGETVYLFIADAASSVPARRTDIHHAGTWGRRSSLTPAARTVRPGRPPRSPPPSPAPEPPVPAAATPGGACGSRGGAVRCGAAAPRRGGLPYLCISPRHLRRPAGTPAPRRRSTRRGRGSQPWPGASPARLPARLRAARSLGDGTRKKTQRLTGEREGYRGGGRCQPGRGNAPAGRSGVGSRPSERR